MSRDPRPPKRLRGAEDDVGEVSQDRIRVDGLKRSEKFWMPDGNIILIAGETAFRVYRGLLTLQSTVFADLFASSSPRAEESYDNCPVIRLTDSPEDLAHLLRVLLPTSRAFFHRSKQDPRISFNEVSAIIRLTHKYHVEDLLTQALASLQESIKTTFTAWEDDSIVTPVVVDERAAIAVVNLARLTDTPSLLPASLYKCCSLDGAIVDGWTREDGNVEYLSSADLKRCINGRNALAKEAFLLVSAILNPMPGRLCTTRGACEAALHNHLADVLEYETVANSAVLDDWTGIIQNGARNPQCVDGYCSCCESELLKRDHRERKRVWNRLPEIFDVDVPNWNGDSDEEEDDDNDADADNENGGN